MVAPRRRVVTGKKRLHIKPGHDTTVTRSGRRLRASIIGEGLPDIDSLKQELDEMTDVLMGRVDPPIWKGVLTLMEVADAYFARASEMARLLHRAQSEGKIPRSGRGAHFRTGELRLFMEMCKRAADLGSRRLTYESLLMEQAKYGRTLAIDEED